METFSALLVLYEGNSSVTDEVPSQRPMTRSIDVFFDLLPNKCLSKQSRRRLFETLSRSSRRHCNELLFYAMKTNWTKRGNISLQLYILTLQFLQNA